MHVGNIVTAALPCLVTAAWSVASSAEQETPPPAASRGMAFQAEAEQDPSPFAGVVESMDSARSLLTLADCCGTKLFRESDAARPGRWVAGIQT